MVEVKFQYPTGIEILHKIFSTGGRKDFGFYQPSLRQGSLLVVTMVGKNSNF